MSNIAVGCSHTYGDGVEHNEAWPSLIGAKNCGIRGASINYIVRILPKIIINEQPSIVYALWPSWSRFEYIDNGNYKQSLPSDRNRIMFMDAWSESRLKENFNSSVETIRNLCKNQKVLLIDMTLEDLVPYIGPDDHWPLSKLGHHYGPIWHQWVAEIFKKKENEQT